MTNEKLKERIVTVTLAVVAVIVLLLGVQASEWIRGQAALTIEARTWMAQQRELMLRQAQQQGLLRPEELANGENGGTAEADGSGATSRKPD